MRLAMVGLGKMGSPMARKLIDAGHQVVGYNRSSGPVKELEQYGGEGAYSLPEAVRALQAPRVVWLMIPSGAPVQAAVEDLSGLLQSGDVVVDGGNSFYRDSQRRADKLDKSGIGFIDCGVSGGVWGYDRGYCLMAGGPKQTFTLVEPAVGDLAPPDGQYAHVGPAGAGHFVKMVHNGIEYGMLQAFGEGFEMLASADELSLDLEQVAELWMHGSVVRSWLLELLVSALAESPRLEEIEGWVDDSGEGRWTVQDAIDRAVPLPSIALSLFARFASRQDEAFSAKVIAALRNQFGGHAVKREE
ncbi:MAG: decarboxylating 6-phosphogluconate dehydrogenase [Actinomycetota bacterium]|nr:decarboxylating 6-phosphogluconate dehydrogenase [Actinomycetota bacterium]